MPAKLPKVVGVDLYPQRAVLDGKGATQQLTVRARYSDGTDRDVTSLAVFLTNNDVSAPVSPDGLVTAGDRGEAFVMARFETHTVGSQFIVLPKGLPFTFPEEPEANYIDKLVNDKLKKLRIAPSGQCDDETFLRRASIDIVGLPPDRRGIQPVHGLDRPREAVEVDRRAARAQGVLRDLGVQVGRAAPGPDRPDQERQPEGHVPLLQLAGRQALQEHADGRDGPGALGASGGTFKNAATNFYQLTKETLPLTENVAQVFMGIRVQCAQCHNHPFDRWTQNDYYSFAAFFAQIGRKQGEDYRETIVFNSGGGEVHHPVGGRAMPPKFLGGEVPERRRQGPSRRAGQVAGVAAESLVRHLVRQPRLGPLPGRRGSSSRSTTSGSATRPRTPSCSRPWASTSPIRSTTSRHSSATSATRGLISARLSATRATRATSGISPTPWSDGSRPRTCSTPSAP